jgi:ribosome maturation factor RimP
MKLKKFSNTEQRVFDAALAIAEDAGVCIWDVCYEKEGGTWYLKVLIDTPGGIDMNKCEAVTRPLSKWLDDEDFISGSYILEVGSPGTQRKLLKAEHFNWGTGKTAEVHLFRKNEKYADAKDLTGVLRGLNAGTLLLDTGTRECAINLEDIVYVKFRESL